MCKKKYFMKHVFMQPMTTRLNKAEVCHQCELDEKKNLHMKKRRRLTGREGPERKGGKNKTKAGSTQR